MSATVQFNASWGVSGMTVSKPKGIVTDITFGEEASFQQEVNGNGSVCHNTYYDLKLTVSMTVVVGTSSSLPDCGKQISINGKMFYVTSASIIESNSAYKKMSVSAERYANCDDAKKPSSIQLDGEGLSSLGFDYTL